MGLHRSQIIVFLTFLAGLASGVSAAERGFDGTVAASPNVTNPAPPALVRQFFNAQVPSEELARQLKIKTAADVRAILPRMFNATSPSHFSVVGALASFDLTPSDYPVRHAINYYVPKSYKPDGTAPVLFVLHGGGASTATYEAAKSMSMNYLHSFIGMAEQEGMILIGPSSSAGWSYVTRILMRRVRTMLLRDLAVDPNRIFFWGHSMGGMGLVRESHWLTGLAAATMPNAAGMQDGAEGHPDNFQIDPFFRTYFDLKVVHANGDQDHFGAFLRRSLKVQKRLKELESVLGQRSGYEYILEEGRDHNPDMATVEGLIRGTMLKLSRNLYQASIFPLLGRLDTKNHRLGPDVDGFTVGDYLWIEAPHLRDELGRQEFEQGSLENYVSMFATVANNTYDITSSDKRLKTVRVLVSRELVDLSKPVMIRLNGQVRFDGLVIPDPVQMLDLARKRGDRAFLFEKAIELKF